MQISGNRERSLTPQMKARIAFMRFGLGPKPGGPARVGMNKDSALEACLKELQDPKAVIIPDEAVKAPATEANGAEVVLDYAKCCRYGITANKDQAPLPWDIRHAEQKAALIKYQEPEVGFVERLVQFWMNHFSIYFNKSHLVNATVGNFERTVIRPHVLGKFSGMLRAALTHTAMVCYLDNQESYGPNSKFGKDRRRSYNENLAREVMELHTVGVGAGYTQADVTNFSKVLTGWTVYWGTDKNGQFCFEPLSHEPNLQGLKIMGLSIKKEGMEQGLEVLDMLQSHPATAQHIAFKLIRHFVTDTPSPNMVKSLARVFVKSGGDLKAMAEALLLMPQSWSEPLNRIRLPYPWVVSITRACRLNAETLMDNEWRYEVYISNLFHPIWGRITPDGYPDENYVWQNPNAILLRKAIARRMTLSGPDLSQIEPAPLAADLLPGVLSPAAAAEIKAATKWDALTILFSSPEYLRR